MDYYVTWNERIFYCASFTTDAEIYSDDWYDAVFAHMEWVDSNGIEDMTVHEEGE